MASIVDRSFVKLNFKQNRDSDKGYMYIDTPYVTFLFSIRQVHDWRVRNKVDILAILK